MKKRIISHAQLIVFSFLAPLVILLIELLPILVFPIKKDLFVFVFLLVQYLGMWIICFAIYNYAYRIIYLNEEAITSGKIKIYWECVQKYELKEIKLLQYSIIPTIYLKSMVFLVGNAGEKIGFAITQKNLKKLVSFMDKNPVINELIIKYHEKIGDGGKPGKTGDGGVSC